MVKDRSKPNPNILEFNSETSDGVSVDSIKLTSYALLDTTSIIDSTEEVDRRAISLLDLLELSEDEQKLADEYDAHYLSNRDEGDKSDELVEEKNPMASFLSPCESPELCAEEEITSDEDEDDESMSTTPTSTTAFAEPNDSLVAKPDYTFDSLHPLMIGVIRTEYEEVPLKDHEWEMMMEMKKVGERVWSWEPSPLRACWSVVRY